MSRSGQETKLNPSLLGYSTDQPSNCLQEEADGKPTLRPVNIYRAVNGEWASKALFISSVATKIIESNFKISVKNHSFLQH
jgi:hypothetical protein